MKEEEKTFLVALPRHRHCSLLSLFVASSFVVSHLLSYKPPVSLSLVVYSSNSSFLVSEPGKLLKRCASLFDIRVVLICTSAIKVAEEYLPRREELLEALRNLSLKERKR